MRRRRDDRSGARWGVRETGRMSTQVQIEALAVTCALLEANKIDYWLFGAGPSTSTRAA